MSAEDWTAFDDVEEEATEAEEFRDVKCIGETDKALLCVFPEGHRRWVPKGQISTGANHNEIFSKGDEGTLLITTWLAEKWEEEGTPKEEAQDMGKAVCLRETEKAILVRLESGREEWTPKSHVVQSSEVQRDGDVGELRISTWLAAKWSEEGKAP